MQYWDERDPLQHWFPAIPFPYSWLMHCCTKGRYVGVGAQSIMTQFKVILWNGIEVN